jgi:hypothetical protein
MEFILSYFGYQAMLGALVLGAVPIIIHILNKQKHKVVEWAAMQFLQLSVTRQNRKMKTEELLLLILRTLLLLFLIFSLARPVIPDNLISDSAAMSDVVFVLDGGRSAAARPGKPTRFDAARDRVKKLIDEMPRGHAVGVVVAFGRPEVLAAPAADVGAEKAKEKLDAVKPLPTGSDMQAAVEKAVELLAAGGHQVKKLVVVGDGRRSGWGLETERLEDWRRIESAVNRLPSARRGQFKSVILTVDDAGGAEDADDDATGLVIRSATVDRLVGMNRRVRINVEVENVSIQPQIGWKLRLIVDGDPKSARELPLADIPATVRLKPVQVATTADGRSVVGVITAADKESVTIRSDTGAEEKLARSAIKSGPRPPSDVMAVLTQRLSEAGADGARRLELAKWAAGSGKKKWALERLADILKDKSTQPPVAAEAGRLKAWLDGVRVGSPLALYGALFNRPGSHVMTVSLVRPEAASAAGTGGATPAGTGTAPTPPAATPSVSEDPRQREELAVSVVDRVPVLIINGAPYDSNAPGMTPGDDEVYFLRRALAPSSADQAIDPKTGKPVEAPATFEVLAPEVFTRGQLAGAVRAETGGDDLAAFIKRKGYKVVVLANVDAPTAGEAAALESFVGSGGGLLVLPGDKTDAAKWNALTWMPAVFAERGGAPLPPDAAPPNKDGRGARLDPAALLTSEVLALVAGTGSDGGLTDADIFKWWRLSPRPGDPTVSMVATLQGGAPLLVRKLHRRGRVILSAIPGDADWTNLPDGLRGAGYVILMNELVYHLAGVATEELRLRAGDEFSWPLPEGWDITRITVQPPGGQPEDARRVLRGDKSYAVFANTNEPGLYRLAIEGRPLVPEKGAPAEEAGKLRTVRQDFVVAARTDIDNEPLSDDDRRTIAGAIAGVIAEDVDKQADAVFTGEVERIVKLIREGAGPKAVWHILAWGVVGFLVLEILMTRRIASRSARAGSGGIRFGQ